MHKFVICGAILPLVEFGAKGKIEPQYHLYIHKLLANALMAIFNSFEYSTCFHNFLNIGNKHL